MKRSQLKELVKEIMAGGYEPDGEGNLVPHYDKFDSTKLSKIFKDILGRKIQGGDAEEGERILTQKSNPENVARILRGEKPIYEEQGQTFNKQELIDYLNSLPPEMTVTIPQIHMSGNFDRNAGWKTTATKAAQALSLPSTSKKDKFTSSKDNSAYPSFSLVQSDEEKQRMEKLVRGMGSLD